VANRSALVTGASRGIGRAIAVALAKTGFDIVVNYRSNASAAEETAELVENAGRRAVVCQADISIADDRRRLLETAVSAFGRIDLLVNNAGIAPSKRVDLLELSEDGFDRVLEVNLKGPFFLTQLVSLHMIEAKKADPTCAPKIINISSISAYTSSVNRGEYCIAKAGISMMTALFAHRLAEYGISVYEIRPGIIYTDMTAPVRERYDRLISEGLTPIRRWGTPEDVARAVVAIASDMFPFSTGEVFNVDGGFHLRRL
jgi:NAD(P)-dependent dehydrogenase (short-subunit alcohol dehydrogenase family)